MTDLPNGFTGRARRDDDFESAGEASRKLQEALASGEGIPGPSTKSAIADDILGNMTRRIYESADASMGRHAKQPKERSEQQIAQTLGQATQPTQALQPTQTSLFAAHAKQNEQFIQFVDAPRLTLFDTTKESNWPDQPSDLRWAWLEIDLAAIRHNVAETRRFLDARTRLMAVVAADAYGHGAVEVSKAVLGAGADRLAVSTVVEGIQLREAGITAPIVMLEQPPATSIPLLLAHHLTPAIYEPDFAIAYGEEADRRGFMAPYHLAVNTGMNNIGVHFQDAAEFLHQVSFHRALELEGTFTQFATTAARETLDFRTQAKRFADALDALHAAGFDPGIVHAADSAATYRFPEVHYDMVRCGTSLYGLHPCDVTRDQLDLQPAMSVHARITDMRILPVSEGVSTGFAYRSPGSVKICTVPIGYADGLSRRLSGKIDFIMNGHYFRQVGMICMSQSMFEVDLRSRKNLACDPQVGDHVLIVGEEGAACVTMDDLAEEARTIPAEMTIGFAQRLARVYT